MMQFMTVIKIEIKKCQGCISAKLYMYYVASIELLMVEPLM